MVAGTAAARVRPALGGHRRGSRRRSPRARPDGPPARHYPERASLRPGHRRRRDGTWPVGLAGRNPGPGRHSRRRAGDGRRGRGQPDASATDLDDRGRHGLDVRRWAARRPQAHEGAARRLSELPARRRPASAPRLRQDVRSGAQRCPRAWRFCHRGAGRDRRHLPPALPAGAATPAPRRGALPARNGHRRGDSRLGKPAGSQRLSRNEGLGRRGPGPARRAARRHPGQRQGLRPGARDRQCRGGQARRSGAAGGQSARARRGL